MPKACKVTFNDETFYANCGDLLLDGALMSGVEMPHDCRSGVCGACKVRLVDGRVFGGTEPNGDTIYACQARVVSDLTLELEPTPEVTSVMARVAEMEQLASDVVGVTVELPRPFPYLPGQFCKVQFRGYPARCYSPTYPLEGAPDERYLHFHIRQLPDGTVSSGLRERIRIGHRVRLSGPYGHAFHRPNHHGRVVIVASGTGFAPMWSVAVGAITERPQREMVFIVASRRLQSFYMDPALCRLALFPNVTIIPVVSEQQTVSSVLRSGRPTDYLPDLSPDDIVYTAGAPAMTEAVAKLAAAAGARCYTDPFVANPTEDDPGLIARVVGWFDAAPRKAQRELHAA